MTSQVPVEKWHDYLSEGNPTVADALLDRLVSGAIRIILRGESMRKVRTQGDLGQGEDKANPVARRRSESGQNHGLVPS